MDTVIRIANALKVGDTVRLQYRRKRSILSAEVS